jgi:condensin complex subunit 2
MLNAGEDNNWGRTGEALGAGAKIYGYRVDNVHMETYKILGGLHRHGLGDHEIEVVMGDDKADEERQDGEDEETKELENSGNKRKKRVLKFTDAQGEKTLDKPENLVLDANFDTEAMVDPLFK